MSAFVDTNVIAYQFDDDEPDKQARATEVLATASTTLHISTQVLAELASVLVVKLRRSRPAARRIVEAVDFHTVSTDRRLVMRALATSDAHDMRIYDALILEAAVEAGCDELWSEDFNTGATLRGVRIVNPFTNS